MDLRLDDSLTRSSGIHTVCRSEDGVLGDQDTATDVLLCQRSISASTKCPIQHLALYNAMAALDRSDEGKAARSFAREDGRFKHRRHGKPRRIRFVQELATSCQKHRSLCRPVISVSDCGLGKGWHR